MKSSESEQETKPEPTPVRNKRRKRSPPKKPKSPVRRIGRREFVEESSDSDSYD
jgi:hypothetical protein